MKARKYAKYTKYSKYQALPAPPATLAVLANLPSQKATPKDGTALHFKPSGKPVLLLNIANALGQNVEEKKALREVLTEGAKLMEVEFAKGGHPNDMAMALAFSLTALWETHSGKSLSDKATQAVLFQLQQVLNTPEMGRQSDTEKQKIYEYGLGVGIFVKVMSEAAGSDKGAKQNLQQLAGKILEQMLKISPEKLRLDEKGLALLAVQSSNNNSSGNAGGVTIATPRGWKREEDKDTVQLTLAQAFRDAPQDPLTINVFLSKAGTAASSATPEKVFTSLYDSKFRPVIPKEAVIGEGSKATKIKDLMPDVCRRLVGNGLRCWFAGIAWEIAPGYLGPKAELHLYAIESGDTWYTMTVILKGRGDVDHNWRTRNNWLEAALAALRGVPSGKALFTLEELFGVYQLSSNTPGPMYYSTITGAAVGTSVLAFGVTLTLRPDGTYLSQMAKISGIGGSTTASRSEEKGTYALQQDATGAFLVQKQAGGKESRSRLVGYTKLPDGRRHLNTTYQENTASLANLWDSGMRYVTEKGK
jgi:hypothetical protein